MKYFLLILIFVLAVSCSNSKIPKGTLTYKEITPVLVELHLAEAILSQRQGQDASLP